MFTDSSEISRSRIISEIVNDEVCLLTVYLNTAKNFRMDLSTIHCNHVTKQSAYRSCEKILEIYGSVVPTSVTVLVR